MSRRNVTHALLTTVMLSLGAVGALHAQQPSPEEIQRLLSDPQAADAIQRRILQSGLTPDQIRARLQAAGFSPTLLDQYFRGGRGLRATPGDSVVRAIGTLGLGNVDELQAFADSIRLAALDSTALDSLLLLDSLKRLDSLRSADTAALRVFGLDVFGRATTQFLPDISGPVDDSYRLGPGDVLVLVLTGDVEFTRELEVTREGFLFIPQVGQVFVSNLTLGQLREVLYDRLGRVYSGVRRGPGAATQFDIAVARVRMVQVYVNGEVMRPGSYRLPSVSSVVTALYAARGPSDRGNLRQIQVLRGRDTVATYDLYDYLLRGVAAGDVRLESGDVVFVPVLGVRVKLAGAVVRPAIYELRPDESLTELIEAAGGFRPDAALQRISISRIVPPQLRAPGVPQRTVVDVPIQQVRDRRAPPFPIEPGDSVTVFAIAEGRQGLVELNGAVYHPGVFGWTLGMRLSDVVSLAGGFQPAIFADRAHIERLNPVDSTRSLVVVPLPSGPGMPYPNDAVLEDHDIITVYGREEFRQSRTVTISGMVNKPGVFPFRDGMTLKDLVMIARGLRDGAYLDTAEIARLPTDRSQGTLAVTIRVPMDSTYLFEPDSTSYRFLPGQSALASGAPEIQLDPFDNVTILRQPGFELQRTVAITGEVRFPGSYALRRKDERLVDLVQRSGGLTPTAHPEGARFIRRLDAAGRVNIDLPAALRTPGTRQDVILQPGDSVDVPEYNPVVRVVGAVNSPGTVLWERGRGLDYYIANAGGYARDADRSLVSVRYANGSARTRKRFMFFTASPEPGPGSTVFIPPKPEAAPTNVAPVFAALAQVLAAAATIIIVATR